MKVMDPISEYIQQSKGNVNRMRADGVAPVGQDHKGLCYNRLSDRARQACLGLDRDMSNTNSFCTWYFDCVFDGEQSTRPGLLHKLCHPY